MQFLFENIASIFVVMQIFVHWFKSPFFLGLVAV